ncbi:MAG TPA: adenylate/guanylate cyclase domain-containing protein [Gammaproteobacteria bacterium]|jgi:class 3 adenylate cyclase|nr:adenylate/guanylate cyclase domain-containing protein [Gammaproteobacteria bacterium]
MLRNRADKNEKAVNPAVEEGSEAGGSSESGADQAIEDYNDSPESFRQQLKRWAQAMNQFSAASLKLRDVASREDAIRAFIEAHYELLTYASALRLISSERLPLLSPGSSLWTTFHERPKRLAEMEARLAAIEMERQELQKSNLEVRNQLYTSQANMQKNEVLGTLIADLVRDARIREEQYRERIATFETQQSREKAVRDRAAAIVRELTSAVGQERIAYEFGQTKTTSSDTHEELPFRLVLQTIARSLESVAGTLAGRDHKVRSEEERAGTVWTEPQRVMIAPINNDDNRKRLGGGVTASHHDRKAAKGSQFLSHILGPEAVNFTVSMGVDPDTFDIGNQHQIFKHTATSGQSCSLTDAQIGETDQRLRKLQDDTGKEHFLFRTAVGEEEHSSALLLCAKVNDVCTALFVLTGGYYDSVEFDALILAISQVYAEQLKYQDATLTLQNNMVTLQQIKPAPIVRMIAESVDLRSGDFDLGHITQTLSIEKKVREATVGMIDVTNSAGLSSKNDSDEFTKIMETFFQIFRRFVASSSEYRDVIIFKYVGDAVMFVVGAPYPVAHHAAIAIRLVCSFMLQAEAEIREKTQTPDFGLHAGIVTGPLVAILRPPLEFDISGATPALDERITKAAGKNGVSRLVVSSPTKDLLHGAGYSFTEHQLAAQGFSDRVVIYYGVALEELEVAALPSVTADISDTVDAPARRLSDVPTMSRAAKRNTTPSVATSPTLFATQQPSGKATASTAEKRSSGERDPWKSVGSAPGLPPVVDHKKKSGSPYASNTAQPKCPFKTFGDGASGTDTALHPTSTAPSRRKFFSTVASS